MSRHNVDGTLKSLPVRLGKTAAFFLFLGVLGFLFVKIVGPILQTGPEYVVESIISGVPLLIAAGCANATLIVKAVAGLHHSGVNGRTLTTDRGRIPGRTRSSSAH